MKYFCWFINRLVFIASIEDLFLGGKISFSFLSDCFLSYVFVVGRTDGRYLLVPYFIELNQGLLLNVPSQSLSVCLSFVVPLIPYRPLVITSGCCCCCCCFAQTTAMSLIQCCNQITKNI